MYSDTYCLLCWGHSALFYRQTAYWLIAVYPSFGSTLLPVHPRNPLAVTPRVFSSPNPRLDCMQHFLLCPFLQETLPTAVSQTLTAPSFLSCYAAGKGSSY